MGLSYVCPCEFMCTTGMRCPKLEEELNPQELVIGCCKLPSGQTRGPLYEQLGLLTSEPDYRFLPV